MTAAKTTNQRKKQKKKTSPQQDGKRDSELFLYLLVSLHVGNKSDKVFLPRLWYQSNSFLVYFT